MQTLRCRRHLPTSPVSIRLASSTRSEVRPTRAQWITTPGRGLLEQRNGEGDDAETKGATMMTSDYVLPAAQELQKRLALAEAQKAAEDARHAAAAEAEKKALLDQLSKPLGIDDGEHMRRAGKVIERAVAHGQTEVFVGRFPNEICTDRGRAINQAEPGWEHTPNGEAKEMYTFWEKHLRARGYRLRVQIVDFPGGMPGDIGATLSWAADHSQDSQAACGRPTAKR